MLDPVPHATGLISLLAETLAPAPDHLDFRGAFNAAQVVAASWHTDAMGVTIRAATKSDAEGITDVQVASWRAGYAHVFPDSILFADDFDASRRDFWTAWRFAPGHRVAVAVELLDERIVGFASYGPERERARGFTGRGEVWALYLHPDAWGTGVATELMEHTEARLRAEGFEDAVLWVLEDNPRARTFYEKFGWSPSGLTADFDDYDEVRLPEIEYRKELHR